MPTRLSEVQLWSFGTSTLEPSCHKAAAGKEKKKKKEHEREGVPVSVIAGASYKTCSRLAKLSPPRLCGLCGQAGVECTNSRKTMWVKVDAANEIHHG